MAKHRVAPTPSMVGWLVRNCPLFLAIAFLLAGGRRAGIVIYLTAVVYSIYRYSHHKSIELLYNLQSPLCDETRIEKNMKEKVKYYNCPSKTCQLKTNLLHFATKNFPHDTALNSVSDIPSSLGIPVRNVIFCLFLR
jgi:hypothetical protein